METLCDEGGTVDLGKSG